MIKVGDMVMGYSETGEGAPLVMIMGYGSTRNLWEPETIDKLAEDFRVITFDNRGIGETERGSLPFSVSQFADDTYGLIKALGIDKTHVLGWSMGSLIAQELALTHPDSVEGLVLYSTFCDGGMFPPDPKVLERLQDRSGSPEERGMRWIEALFPREWTEENGERIKDIFWRPMGEIPGETLAGQAEAIYRWKGSKDRLEHLPSATLLITGDRDILTPNDNSEFMVSRIPGTKLAMIEGAGHGLMFQDPDHFLSIVKRFLLNT